MYHIDKLTPTAKRLVNKGLTVSEANMAVLLVPLQTIYLAVFKQKLVPVTYLTPFRPNEMKYFLRLASVQKTYEPVISAFDRGATYIKANSKGKFVDFSAYEETIGFQLQNYPELLQELELKEVQFYIEQANPNVRN